ncbi:MAG TPA: hypothetical protein VH593_08400, partial [Ktedonobacteraceae bacterium]
SRHSWHYRQGSNPALDFCLWTLEVDGLRVPPFDQHPDGDGSLRALGLTADAWQTWFLRALDPAQSEHDVEELQRNQAEQLKSSAGPPLPPPPEFHYYQASWDGSVAIKNKLNELEKQFRQISSQREKIGREVEVALHREERKATTRLYDELKPYHHRIPPLNICFVTYASPLDYLAAPATLLMTLQEGQPGFQEFRERVLAAVEELAKRPNQRKKPSAYTRLETSSGHFIAYRSHMRRHAPPPLPRPEVPILDDPLKQMVVEELMDKPLFGALVDPTSIHFQREKQRPGWKLYEITFQELDGEQQRMIYILQQSDDGSWRVNGGGTSSDMQNQWSKIFAPVRDHPLILLGFLGRGVGGQQYLQTAHGDVIDNGFHVERVRMVNEAGQVLEDMVEDGYVFFACKPEEQVQLPMQVQLYDHEGKLVWQQKFPDDGLPPWLKLKHQR